MQLRQLPPYAARPSSYRLASIRSGLSSSSSPGSSRRAICARVQGRPPEFATPRRPPCGRCESRLVGIAVAALPRRRRPASRRRGVAQAHRVSASVSVMPLVGLVARFVSLIARSTARARLPSPRTPARELRILGRLLALLDEDTGLEPLAGDADTRQQLTTQRQCFAELHVSSIAAGRESTLAGASQTTPSGGSVTSAENSWSFHGSAPERTTPMLPTPDPP